jgi:putative endonuclease
LGTGYKKGLLAETLAAWILRLKCYRVLAMRYKTRVGEIDIVAQRGRTVVFTEVKFRQTADHAAEAIGTHNQSRVRQAAALYLQKHPEYNGYDCRFDAVVLAPGKWPRHIENAF